MDRQIVHILTIEPRASFRTIAAVIGISDQTAARRYRRLEESAGLRVLGVPDGSRLGWTDWFLRLQTTPGGADSLAEALARRPGHQVGPPRLGRHRDHLHAPGPAPRNSVTPCSCTACPAAAASFRSPRTPSCTTSPRARGNKPPARCPPLSWPSSRVPQTRIRPLAPPCSLTTNRSLRSWPAMAGPACRARGGDPLARVDGAAPDRRALPVRPAVLRGRHRQPGAWPEHARHTLAVHRTGPAPGGGHGPGRASRDPVRRLPRPGRATWSPAPSFATLSISTST